MVSRPTGFSLIELLVVMAIILVLAGMLLVAGTHVRNAQRSLNTQRTMRSLAHAIEVYLKDEALLGGADAQGDLLAPLAVLHFSLPPGRRTLALAAGIALEDTSGNQSGPFRPGTSNAATHLADAWRRPIRVRVVNEPLPAANDRQRTRKVLLRSSAGTPWDADDLVLELDVTDGEWQRVQVENGPVSGPWVTSPL